MTDQVADVVFTRRTGRLALPCAACGREITVGQRYTLTYQAVERDGKRAIETEARHERCPRKGV